MPTPIFTASKLLPPENVFLVGGAVRDHLLGVANKDHDYVVVGKTPQEMTDLGFAQVGKDFPVFLDPQDKNEYALARIERKTGVGYHGFAVECEGVTLEQDLERRDLTINAMAMGFDGKIIDPFGGQRDLDQKVLRHVGPAFGEDPLRVLRVARFAARYADLGFTVSTDTMDMMREMVARGEVDHLVAERVWLEFTKACSTPKPSVFLRVLHECGALARILPEVDALYGVPQAPQYHPEIDTGVHTEMVLDMAVQLAPGDVAVAFAALTHDLGKALTPKDELPKHLGHEKSGLIPLEGLIKRWKTPTDAAELARTVCVYHLHAHRALESRTGTLLDLIERCDGLRRPDKFKSFVLACEADKRGRLGWENYDYPQRDLLLKALDVARSVSGRELAEQGLSGLEIKEEMRKRRLRVIKTAQGVFAREQKEREEAGKELSGQISVSAAPLKAPKSP